jgi:DNA-binding FadR family transcriptional regulator
MMWHVLRARPPAHQLPPLAPDAARHHDAIVDANFARDADAASLAMRYHLSKVVRSVIARLDDPKTRAHPLQLI